MDFEGSARWTDQKTVVQRTHSYLESPTGQGGLETRT